MRIFYRPRHLDSRAKQAYRAMRAEQKFQQEWQTQVAEIVANGKREDWVLS